MNQKKINISVGLTAFVLIFIISACSNEPENETNTKYSTAEEVLTLNNKNLPEGNPIISFVSLVTTDDENNIYLVDARTSKIHSYTNDLSHRWSAGGKGDGPGLFNMISALYVDDQQLYVYEYANSTMTLYTLSGERLREWSFGESGHPINNIRRTSNGKFFTTGLNEKNGAMLNVYSDDFKNRTSRFIKISGLFTTESPELEKQVLRNYPGSVIPAGDSTLIYAPAAYSGQLPVYNMNSAGNWKKIDTVQGYKNIETPLFFSKSSDGNSNRTLLSGYDPNNGSYFHAEFNSMSRGLYELNDGRIAHLSLRLNESDQWDLIIEYFDFETLELQDHTIIEGLIPSQQLKQRPMWMDGDGKVYISQQSDTPLRIIEISSN